jgi:hypothetical protein
MIEDCMGDGVMTMERRCMNDIVISLQRLSAVVDGGRFA